MNVLLSPFSQKISNLPVWPGSPNNWPNIGKAPGSSTQYVTDTTLLTKVVEINRTFLTILDDSHDEAKCYRLNMQEANLAKSSAKQIRPIKGSVAGFTKTL